MPKLLQIFLNTIYCFSTKNPTFALAFQKPKFLKEKQGFLSGSDRKKSIENQDNLSNYANYQSACT